MAHISEELLQAYVHNRLPAGQEQAVMEHIAMCGSCARRFASLMEKGMLVTPPPDLKKEILEKTVNRKSPVSEPEELWKRKSRQRRELLAYSVRVVVAMAASIMILLTMSFQGNTGRMPEEIMQVQKKTVFVFTKDGISKKTVSEKTFEDSEKKKESEQKANKKITDSLREMSGGIQEVLSDFWEQFQ
jgi:Predicted transmembrane transcriptional regulator (anti-sigma factor)